MFTTHTSPCAQQDARLAAHPLPAMRSIKEVTVVVQTNKSLLGKPSLSSIEVYGLGESKASKPNLQELVVFLGQAELTQVR